MLLAVMRNQHFVNTTEITILAKLFQNTFQFLYRYYSCQYQIRAIGIEKL